MSVSFSPPAFTLLQNHGWFLLFYVIHLIRIYSTIILFHLSHLQGNDITNTFFFSFGCLNRPFLSQHSSQVINHPISHGTTNASAKTVLLCVMAHPCIVPNNKYIFQVTLIYLHFFLFKCTIFPSCDRILHWEAQRHSRWTFGTAYARPTNLLATCQHYFPAHTTRSLNSKPLQWKFVKQNQSFFQGCYTHRQKQFLLFCVIPFISPFCLYLNIHISFCYFVPITAS